MRGTSHERTNTRRQDAFRCTAVDHGRALVAVACDGAGSATHGGEGASLVARRLSLVAEAHLREHPTLPEEERVRVWIDEVRDLIATTALRRSLRPRDFATTLVMVVATPEEVLTVHVGDGAVVGRFRKAEHWDALAWPEHGEFASTTYFVTDEAEVRARIKRYERQLDQVAVLTDGIERLALDLSNKVPHAPFFSGVSAPVQRSEVIGRDGPLSAKLSQYLASDTINERTDDDKTLIVAVHR